MAEVAAADVKRLRAATGAGMMECKKALVDADGDFERAADLVRERTGAKMDRRAAERTASDGLVHAYLHAPTPGLPPKVGVLLQLHCESDFVAKNDVFQQLARDLALHIAAMKPEFVAESDIDDATLDKERDFARKQAIEDGKADAIVERIVEGKLKAFVREQALLNQPFVKDDSKTVGQLLSEVQATLGEKVEVGRFVRFQIG